MSHLVEFRKLEEQLVSQRLELEAINEKTDLKINAEFETKLISLLDEYDHTLERIINLLDPEAGFRLLASARQTLRMFASVHSPKNRQFGHDY